MATPEVLDPTVDLLVGLAEGGRALEFAIGTGRVALPLAERGVDVAGIELSAAMVRQLRSKPGGETMDVVIGDMTTAQAGRRDFSLVYLVYNTIHNLVTQDLQVACFQNASAHLRPGGHFLIEVLVPPLQRLPEGERFQPFDITDDHWGIDEFDVATQAAVSHHIRDNEGRFERFSLPYRYVWPSELDLMGPPCGDVTGRAVGGLGPVTVHGQQREAHLRVAQRRMTSEIQRHTDVVRLRLVLPEGLARVEAVAGVQRPCRIEGRHRSRLEADSAIGA